MNLQEAFRIAIRALSVNRLRSALTTLGIVIGVASVIVLVALADGVQAGFNDTFSALANHIIVTKIDGSVPSGGAAKDLTDSDVSALRNLTQAPDIGSVTPVITGTALVQAGTGQFRASVAGSTAAYLDVNNREMMVGSFFTETEERSNAKLVVLGPDLVANLFGGDARAALGKKIRITRTAFKVIGVVKRDGQQDDLAIMPLGAARSYLLGGTDSVNAITVTAASTHQVPAALDQITKVLTERHNIKDPAKRDFEARALQNLLDSANEFLGFLTLFTAAIAAISLIVGGIGIANIMLVSVTERTREIGIRKAIGARRSTILKQFLIESTVLSVLGGFAGIIIGVAISMTAAVVLPAAVPDFPAPQLSITPIVLAFAISLGIGLGAGVYPANRAARLRPIEALRYE